MLNRINQLKLEFESDISTVPNMKEIEGVRIKYLGRNGSITALFEELKDVSKDEKPAIGKELNLLKKLVENKFKNKKEELESASKTFTEWIDLSLPAREKNIGTKHVITQTMDEIKNIFKGLGFSVFEGPELDSDYYNFEALNFPADHPARDMQDTFFINNKFLLRTHTSPVQIRVMSKYQPPVRAIMPGKVFRNEVVNARSHCQFHQVEGLYVDEGVTFAELKGTLVAFAKQFYGSDLKYRFRPSFFPFTEPSAEMDITCYICKGKGCRICKQSGWLEILGCGMVDPNVFKYVNYDSEKVTGYAFGMGIERVALLRYDMKDIRLFFDSDVRFLKQF